MQRPIQGRFKIKDRGLSEGVIPRLMSLFQIFPQSKKLKAKAENLLNSRRKNTNAETPANSKTAVKVKKYIKRFLWVVEKAGQQRH